MVEDMGCVVLSMVFACAVLSTDAAVFWLHALISFKLVSVDHPICTEVRYSWELQGGCNKLGILA